LAVSQLIASCPTFISCCGVLALFDGCFAGNYWILYDFIQYFNKDEASFLDQDKFREIIDTIFKNASKLEKDAITFQVINLIIINLILI